MPTRVQLSFAGFRERPDDRIMDMDNVPRVDDLIDMEEERTSLRYGRVRSVTWLPNKTVYIVVGPTTSKEYS